MQIIINTIEGTFIVPTERQADLIYWLKQNANWINKVPVGEQHGQSNQNYSGRQFITEEGK